MRPSSYVALSRAWRDGDRVEVELPMRTTVERLPVGSDWVAFLRGPIELVSPAGTNNLTGLRANDSQMGHVASGPMIPLDQVPVLLANADELPGHVKPDAAAGPMRFRLTDVEVPESAEGLPLMPFFRLHDARYQMYWQLTTKEAIASRRERLAAEERAAGRNQVDLSLMKRFIFGERHHIEVRADFLNLFNHSQFIVMNRKSFVVDYATFGMASSLAPRRIQFMLKYSF